MQTAPETTMTIEDFLTRTVELGADGVYATHIKDIRFQSGMPTALAQAKRTKFSPAGSAPKLPPMELSPYTPVAGERLMKEHFPEQNRYSPVRGPGAITSRFSGPRGSTSKCSMAQASSQILQPEQSSGNEGKSLGRGGTSAAIHEDV